MLSHLRLYPLLIPGLLAAGPGGGPAAAQATAEASEKTAPRRIPTERAIEMFEARVEKNPADHLSLTVLGRLHLRHAEQEDDLQSYAKAERTLLRAREADKDYEPARIYLAIAMQARHGFAESLELLAPLLEESDPSPLVLATAFDAELGMGRYDTAEKLLTRLIARRRSPAVIARQARLAELTGRVPAALLLLEQARKDAEGADRSPSDLAWYAFRCGDLRWAQGDLKASRRHFEQALEADPDFPPAGEALAAVTAAEGEYSAAIEAYSAVVKRSGAPPAMAALGDVYEKTGRPELARQWWDRAEAAMVEEAKVAAAAHYREVANFLCDHDRELPTALSLARKDLQLRPDPFGYDTLAWALYKNGRYTEAESAMDKALKWGTQDARLLYHAGMIQHALKHPERAADLLSQCLAMNPHFSLLQADVARRTSSELNSDVASQP